LILALETSGRQGSVAIAQAGELAAEKKFSAPMKHSKEIFPAITELLENLGKKPANIEQVYVSVGPGSFTGLRIAVTVAKMLQLAKTDVKVVAVDTLDVIASNTAEYIKRNDVEKVAAILDAKRNQFFVAVYKNTENGLEKILQDSLISAEDFIEKFAGQSVLLLGEGLVYYKDKFKADGFAFLDERYWIPKAAKVYQLGWEKAQAGEFSDALTLQPKYIQRPDAKMKN